MKKTLGIAIVAVLLTNTPAHAISAKYRQQLERSGCTEVSEMQGCDIKKTKAQNAKACSERSPHLRTRGYKKDVIILPRQDDP